MLAPNTYSKICFEHFFPSLCDILHIIFNCVPQYYNPDKAHNEHLPVNRKDLTISDYLWKSNYPTVLPEQSHPNVRGKATTHTDNGDCSAR